MNEYQLMEIEQRANNATPGPWSNVDTSNWDYPCVFVGKVPNGIEYDPAKHRHIANLSSTVGKMECEKDNAEFIAHAREDVPLLIAEIRRLQVLINTNRP